VIEGEKGKPFVVNETGWGEFEITLKLYYATESGEKAQTLYHHLHLHPYGKTDEEKARSRVLLLDQNHRVLASSDGKGVLEETFKLDTSGGDMGSYAEGDLTVGYALTPGYETYQGLGWYGCLVQTSEAGKAAATFRPAVTAAASA
jgi:hypothetical protein